MSEPVPELDPRFSDPTAVPTDWSTTQRIIEDAELSWITTVRADGRPHVTPLVSVWLEGAAYFTTGGDEQKAHNLVHNAAVVITTGCNTWEGGLDVMIEGHAVHVTDRSTLERLAVLWSGKWDGRWRYEAAEGGFRHHDERTSVVFRVDPEKILTFGKGAFTHTRYRFNG